MVKIKDPELINIYDYTLIKSSINQARQQKTLEKQSKKTNIKKLFYSSYVYFSHAPRRKDKSSAKAKQVKLKNWSFDFLQFSLYPV